MRWPSVALLVAAGALAAVGALAVSSFYGEYGDIARSGFVQALPAAVVVGLFAAVPAGLAVVASPRSRLVLALAAVVVLGGLVGTGALSERAVVAKEAGMPRSPWCGDATSASEDDPEKDAGAAELTLATAPFRDALRELDSPGRFGEGSGSVTGCTGQLVAVEPATAVAFYADELPQHGWTVTERAQERLVGTRDDLTFVVEAEGDVTTVQVRLTDSR